MKKRFVSREVVWLALIACAALALRLVAIDRLPPGLFGDEAVEGLDALDVLAGNFYIWFHAHLGREPLFVYLVALSYQFFGITPLATRLPALAAGVLTLPTTFFLAREWGLSAFGGDRPRATRVALLTAGVLAISFWHIQMTRDAHRDTLVPLVEAVGYFFLWRGLRAREWKFFAAAGAFLGLAVYTYSPGRFVVVFVAIFFAVEFLLRWKTNGAKPNTRDRQPPAFELPALKHLGIAAASALVVILPLGIYFAQNPAQFVRRFDSASILNAPQPLAALAESVAGNLAQFVVPGAGYQSKHYNVPGKPVFDLFLAPWFLAGFGMAFVRWRNSAYRFLILWFFVMLTPPFLTADMIPKGVRGLGTLPGVLIFIAIAMDWAVERARVRSASLFYVSRFAVTLTLVGSTIWTTYDYFITWANLPELPIAFDSDYAETSAYVRDLPATQSVYVSVQVYRHPTFMLLGQRVPTSRYFDRATRIKEFDATRVLVTNGPDAIAVFVRDQSPPEDWYRRLAPQNERVAGGRFFAAYRLRDLAPPARALSESFNPLVHLAGISAFGDEPPGIALYWRIVALPTDRAETKARLTLLDARGQTIAQKEERLGYPPLDWGVGEMVIEWFEFDALDGATQFTVELTRGSANWKSSMIQIK